MKIAIIAEQLAFPLIHAPHQQIFQIQKRLIQRGHEVTVLCLLSHKKSHSRSFLDSRHFRELIQSIKRINKILKEQKFDIVHLHFNLMALLWVMKFLPKTTKNIVVYPFKGKCGTNELTRFSLNNILNPSILKLKLRKFMSFAVPNFILRDCLNNNRIKAIMVPSFQAKNLLTPILRTNKIHVLPLGIDFEKVTAQRVPDSHLLKEDLGLSKYDKVIAYFGWLSPNRGVKTLISAIPILHKRIPKINLLLLSPPSSLVETGPVLKSIQSSLTKNKIKLKLQFLPNVLDYVNLADIMVFPYLESFGVPDYPITIMESMALGKPIVASRVGALGELIKDFQTGILFEPGNLKQLVDAIFSIMMDDSLANRISSNAREQVQNYSWDKIIDDLLKIYVGVVN